MRLRFKIAIPLLFLSIIPFLLIGAVGYYNGVTILKKTIGGHFQYVAQETVSRVDARMDEFLRAVRIWTQMDLMQEVIHGDPGGHIVRYLSMVKENDEALIRLDVLNSAGNVIATTEGSRRPDDLSREEFFKQAISGEPYISDVELPPKTPGENSFGEEKGRLAAALPIYSKHKLSEDPIGVLRVIWRAEYFSELLRKFSAGQSDGRYIALMRSDGLVIAVDQPPKVMEAMVFQVNLIEQKLKAARMAQQQQEGYGIEKEAVEREDYLIGYSYSKGHGDFKGLGWGALVIQNTDKVFEPVRQLRVIILGIGFLIALGVVLSFLGISKDITQPVLGIATVADEVSKGNLDARVSYSSSDEVGELAKTFNQMISDLKEQRRQLASGQERLRETEARAGMVLKEIIESVVVIDQHGIIQLFNPAAEELFGYTAEEAVGRNVNMLMPPPYKEEHDTYIANYLRTGQKKVIGIDREVIGRHKGGTIFPMELRVSEVVVGQDRRLFIGVTRDITERRQAEEILKKAIIMKDEFISTVSHELRTPLSIVKEGLSLLRRERVGRLSGQQKEVVAMTADNIDRLSVLIDDILDVSKLEAGRMTLSKEPVNVVDLIKENCRGWFLQADTKDIRMRLKAAAGAIILAVDKVRFIQIFSNLLSNAVKFTPEGGTIDIMVEEMADKVKFAVRDTGPGIDPENVPRLFEKFRQFSRTYGPGRQGTGLGLSITKSLVELHGGYSGVESEVGKGSTFFFTLPKGGSHLHETWEDQS